MTLGFPPPAPGFPSCRRSPSPHAVLTTPVDRFWYCSVGSRFPAMGFPSLALAFPERTAGRHPHLSFRGLLKLHSRYGLRIRSSIFSIGLGRKAPTPAVTGLRRFSATQVIPTTPGAGLAAVGNLGVEGARSFVHFCVSGVLPKMGSFRDVFFLVCSFRCTKATGTGGSGWPWVEFRLLLNYDAPTFLYKIDPRKLLTAKAK